MSDLEWWALLGTAASPWVALLGVILAAIAVGFQYRELKHAFEELKAQREQLEGQRAALEEQVRLSRSTAVIDALSQNLRLLDRIVEGYDTGSGGHERFQAAKDACHALYEIENPRHSLFVQERAGLYSRLMEELNEAQTSGQD